MTLPEVLVSLVIIAITSVIISTAYLTTVKITRRERSRSAVVLGSGRVLGPLDELLGQGTAVLSQYPTSGAATVTTGTSSLVFAVPSLDNNGELTALAADLVTITTDTTIPGNARLLMTIYPDTGLPSTRVAETVVIATNVLDVYFRYPTVNPTDAHALSITLRLQKTDGPETASQTLSLNTILRNHP